MPNIIIYATQYCPYCTMAKRLLDGKGASYEVLDVGGSRDDWKAMEQKTGRNTVPQIYVGDHHVGGFDDLSAADKRGELDKLLQG